MRERLTAAGMRPISLAVDVTNYVMLDLGQPLHAFDLAKLHGPIVVRRARAGESLAFLDGVMRVLDVEDLVIFAQRQLPHRQPLPSISPPTASSRSTIVPAAEKNEAFLNYPPASVSFE